MKIKEGCEIVLEFVLSVACLALSKRLGQGHCFNAAKRMWDEGLIPCWCVKEGTKMCSLTLYWWAVAMAVLTGCARPLDPEDDRESTELEEDMGRAA